MEGINDCIVSFNKWQKLNASKIGKTVCEVFIAGLASTAMGFGSIDFMLTSGESSLRQIAHQLKL